MKSMDLLTGADYAILASYCDMFSKLRRSVERDKCLGASFYVNFKSVMAKLGLTPMARSKLIVGKKKDSGNKFANL